jgi:hypothetical protein
MSRKLWLGAVVLPLTGLGALSVACGSGRHDPAGTSGGVEAGYDDVLTSTPTPGSDAGDDAPDDAPPPQGYLRIAHASPDAPQLDVCVAPHGTTEFRGPLLGGLAASLDGTGVDAGDAGGADTDAGAVGLSYAQVSAYVALAAGQYDVRIVAAGSSCGSPLAAQAVEDASADDASLVDAGSVVDSGGTIGVADTTSLPSLDFNTYATLLVAGELAPVSADAPIQVTLLTDDAVLAGGAAVLRAINAAPSRPSLDFGLGSAAAWQPLLTDIGFGAASRQTGQNQGTVDANGYTPIAPLHAQAMSARASFTDAGADAVVASDVEIDFGSIATVLAIGGKTGDPAHPLALLLCMDNQPSGGLLSDCSVPQ